METIASFMNAMASVREVLSRFALLYPFIGVFILLWLIFRRTKPGVNPFMRWKFWIVFLGTVLTMVVLLLIMLLIALSAGAKKMEAEQENEKLELNQ